MEYLKIFNTTEEYEAWKAGDNYVFPNVCKVGEEIIYSSFADPLWIEAVEDITVYIKVSSSYAGSWSIDKLNWNKFTKEYVLRTGEKLYLSYLSDGYTPNLYISGKYNVGGNIQSLFFGLDYIHNTTARVSFSDVFKSAKNVINAKDLVFPDVWNSTSSAAYGSCKQLFLKCSLLQTAPDLKNRKLVSGCYYGMFSGCTSLVIAPVLSEHITDVSYCYNSMFKGCSNLSYIKCMSTSRFTTSTNGNHWSYDWVNGVSESGTFIANVNRTDFTRGIHGIPTGWDLYLYDEDNDRYVIKFKVNNIPYEFYTDEPRNVTWNEFINSDQNTNDFRKGYWNDATATAITVKGTDNILLSGKIVNSFDNIVLNAAYTTGQPTETTEE